MEFQRIIDGAIKQEESSYRLYMNGYNKTTITSARQLFKKLAGEELKHKRLLQSMDLKKVSEFPESKYDSLHLEDDLLLTPINELNEIKEILEFALKKEIKAYNQYSGIARILPFGKMKAFFEKLAGEEQKHKKLVLEEHKKLF